MTIGGNKNDHQTYYMQREGVIHNLQVSEEETDLGVTIDSKLTFDAHISNKINKVTKMIRIIRRTYQIIDMDTFLPLYKCMVRPHLDYANFIWYPNKKKHIQAIENVQIRATKQLPGLHNLSYSDRLKKLRLPTLTYRRLRGDMIETYKIINNIYDQESSPKLSRCEDIVERTGNRGHPHKLYKLRPKKTNRKFSFPLRIVEPWNSLPINVIQAETLNKFKNRLDKHWSTQECLYDFNELLRTGTRNENTRDLITEDPWGTCDILRYPKVR